ncbi:MAG: hypothetical protein JRG92_11330 [Deltaproteobacteria bacterium]|nr:hypothetical protein [Deltaproteobacteria bacterium]MBW2384219.1 hypothetical protein [Deltaproteobacteria bacterium]MBW2696552.1 hypothetical protein [Deltaproteobacteria bacterium]
MASEGERTKTPLKLAVDYPPTYHLLRDLGVWLERDERGNRAGHSDWVTTDLSIHYLALGRFGPIRTTSRLLRVLPDSALVRVEVRDAGADDRLVCVATATVEAPI